MPPRPETARRRICRLWPSTSRPGFRSRTSRIAAACRVSRRPLPARCNWCSAILCRPRQRLIALGMTGLRRARIAPDIPTFDESGLPGFNITAWVGVVAPKGTPGEIVQKLNLEIGRALKEPEFARQISAMGLDPLGSTPGEFAAFLRKEIPRWRQIARDADVKVEGAR